MKESIPGILLILTAIWDCLHVFGVMKYYGNSDGGRHDYQVFHLRTINNVSDNPPYIYDNKLYQPFSKKQQPWLIYFHVAAGIIPSALGAWQLWDFARKKSIKTHRFVGYIWVITGMVTAIQGSFMSKNMTFSHNNDILRVAVFLLGVATGISTGLLYYYIALVKEGPQVQFHRQWAMRAWLFMQFFIIWARLCMGIFFIFFSNPYSFVIGGWFSLITTLPLMEYFVYLALKRSGKEKYYRVLGPWPCAEKLQDDKEENKKKKV